MPEPMTAAEFDKRLGVNRPSKAAALRQGEQAMEQNKRLREARADAIKEGVLLATAALREENERLRAALDKHTNHVEYLAMQEEIDRLRAAIAAKDAALLPFAKAADDVKKFVYNVRSKTPRIAVNLDDCRKAREALTPPSGGSGTSASGPAESAAE